MNTIENITYREYISGNSKRDEVTNEVTTYDDNIVNLWELLTIHKSIYLQSKTGSGKTEAIKQLATYLWTKYEIKTIIILPNLAVLEDKRCEDKITTTVNGLGNEALQALDRFKIVQTTPDTFSQMDIREPILIATDEMTTLTSYAGFKDTVIAPMLLKMMQNNDRGGWNIALDGTDVLIEKFGFTKVIATKVDENGNSIEPIRKVKFCQTQHKLENTLFHVSEEMKSFDSNEYFGQFRFDSKDLLHIGENYFKETPMTYVYTGGTRDMAKEINSNRRWIDSQEEVNMTNDEYDSYRKDVIKKLQGGYVPEGAVGVCHTRKLDVGVNISTTKKVKMYSFSNRCFPEPYSVAQSINRRRQQKYEDKLPVEATFFGYFGDEEPDNIKLNSIKDYMAKRTLKDTIKALEIAVDYIESSKRWTKEFFEAQLEQYGIEVEYVDYNYEKKVSKDRGSVTIINHLETMTSRFQDFYSTNGDVIYDYIPEQSIEILTPAQEQIAIDIMNMLDGFIKYNYTIDFITRDNGAIEVKKGNQLIDVSKSLEGALELSQTSTKEQWKLAVKLIEESTNTGQVIKDKLNSIKDRYIKSSVKRYFEFHYNLNQNCWNKHKASKSIRLNV